MESFNSRADPLPSRLTMTAYRMRMFDQVPVQITPTCRQVKVLSRTRLASGLDWAFSRARYLLNAALGRICVVCRRCLSDAESRAFSAGASQLSRLLVT